MIKKYMHYFWSDQIVEVEVIKETKKFIYVKSDNSPNGTQRHNGQNSEKYGVYSTKEEAKMGRIKRTKDEIEYLKRKLKLFENDDPDYKVYGLENENRI